MYYSSSGETAVAKPHPPSPSGHSFPDVGLPQGVKSSKQWTPSSGARCSASSWRMRYGSAWRPMRGQWDSNPCGTLGCFALCMSRLRCSSTLARSGFESRVWQAFGMGIDKQDIRNLVLWKVPTGMATYIQQVG